MLPIVGLGMRCEGGALDLRGTLEENAQRLPAILARNATAWLEASRFEPDAVITDFDFFAWAVARTSGLPLLSIDNGLSANLCIHSPSVLGYAQLAALKRFNRLMVPDADRYILTTFFDAPIDPSFTAVTTVVPPILRRQVIDVLRKPPAASDHVLVYKTGSLDDATFVNGLAALPETRFRIYGLKQPDSPMPPNIQSRPFDQTAFLLDVASARAVVGNGGMSLIGEALALGIPLYAVPVRGQLEQVLNAWYIAHLGYGVTSAELEPAILRSFLSNLDHHRAAIASRPQHDDNRLLHARLDSLFGGTPSRDAPSRDASVQ